MSKINFIEINYYCHLDMSEPDNVIQKHKPSNLFATHLVEQADVALIKHMNFVGHKERNGIHYHFFKKTNHFFNNPINSHRLIAELKPDLVLVQGFIFPIQVMHLRKKAGKNVIILLQHQGEAPTGKKRFLQRFADRYVNGYIFSAKGNAKPWIKARIINDISKCFEMPSSSTLFSKQDKEKSRVEIGMKKGINFLWVGRLDANKDPLTVLKGFEKYCSIRPDSYLSLIYGEDEQEGQVKDFINKSVLLKVRTKLVGKLANAELEKWYSAADYYISGSWSEGGSYALTEAMACGCVPIVTNIPASMKAIDNGRLGYFFEPGDDGGLAKVLSGLNEIGHDKLSKEILENFEREMSGKAIAEKLLKIYDLLYAKKSKN